jgi:hypothetical protein
MTATSLPEDIMILYVQLVAYARNRKNFRMRAVQKKNILVANYNLYVKEQKPVGDDDRVETSLTLCTDDENASFMSTNLK